MYLRMKSETISVSVTSHLPPECPFWTTQNHQLPSPPSAGLGSTWRCSRDGHVSGCLVSPWMFSRVQEAQVLRLFLNTDMRKDDGISTTQWKQLQK